MKRIMTLAGAFGLGLGAMYFFDPAYGRRRRALARDRFHASMNRASCMARKAREDLANRSHGMAAALPWHNHQEDSDPVVEARAHTALGRLVSHPHAVHVQVIDGCATLRGPVLAHEVAGALAGVAAVRGVRDVDNQLDAVESPGNIPALQGNASLRQSRFILARESWPPSARLCGLAASAAMGIWSMFRRGIAGRLLCLGSIALALRSLTNLTASRLTGIGAGPRAVDLRKTITINAPIEDVFNFWGRFENLPRFMGHVRSVRDLGEGRSEWTVAGPAGTAVKWNARITEFRPYDLIAWETEPGSTVEHCGLIRFAPTPSGGTRLDIFMSYNPVAGAIGHLLARLLGRDPKTAMDQDFVRLKTLLEQGADDMHTIHRGNLSMASSESEDYGNPT